MYQRAVPVTPARVIPPARRVVSKTRCSADDPTATISSARSWLSRSCARQWGRRTAESALGAGGPGRLATPLGAAGDGLRGEDAEDRLARLAPLDRRREGRRLPALPEQREGRGRDGHELHLPGPGLRQEVQLRARSRRRGRQRLQPRRGDRLDHDQQVHRDGGREAEAEAQAEARAEAGSRAKSSAGWAQPTCG